MYREGLFEHHRRDALAIVAAAAGGQPLGQGVLGPCPEGYAWYVELAAFQVVGAAHNAIVALVVTPDNGPLPSFAGWDGYGLQAVSGAAASFGSFPLQLPLYVPPGNFLRAIVQGGTLANGDAVTVSVQTAVHQLDLGLGLMSPEDRAQVLAAHEHVGAPLAQTAVAENRAV